MFNKRGAPTKMKGGGKKTSLRFSETTLIKMLNECNELDLNSRSDFVRFCVNFYFEIKKENPDKIKDFTKNLKMVA